ncbi:hypothetical protein, partial [Brachyspira pilosicoli]|uniref:hypothetical protein n=1 Tax=Brachyspira pilosicoli TaxID=52584 RepID=UPI00215510B7
LISVLFLISLLAVSCSNANKTGSGDNNSGNGGSGIGGDGSTTPTPEGIAKYAGTWTAKFNATASYKVIIGTDGKVTIDDGSLTTKEATDITENGNTYTMSVQHIVGGEHSTVTIIFTDEKSGTINDTYDFYGNGVIKKQNGGNKGLWYYSGTWEFQETNPGAEKGTIVIAEDSSVTFTIAQKPYTTKYVTDKGNETYEVKFVDEDPNDGISSTLILTLKFNNDDNTGSYEAKLDDIISSGTLTKQK